MNNLITYIIELNIALSILFLVYLLTFRKDGNFTSRRIYLFIAAVISLILPLLKLNIGSPSGMFSNGSPVIELEEFILVADSKNDGFIARDFRQIIWTLYFLVTILFILRLVGNALFVAFHSFRSPSRTIGDTSVRINKTLHASSFFNTIFIDPDRGKKEDIQMIIAHEICHAQLRHSLDRILSEFLVSVSWFNPVVWLYRKAMIVNHEYQADNKVIIQGADNISYQLTILNQYIGSASITNQFSNQIKNRITMLNKNYKKGGFWKSLVLIPAALFLLFVVACNNESADETTDVSAVSAEETKSVKSPEEEIFYVVEEMPKWNNGEDMITEMRKFIAYNIKYPDKAVAAGAQGKVYVHFIVTNTGDVIIPSPEMLPPEKAEDGTENEVVVVSYKPIDPASELPDEELIDLLKQEAVRVIEQVPDMIPGKQSGKAVNVIFTMPINFVMQ